MDAVVSGVGTGGTLVGLYLGCAEVGCNTIPVHARPFNLYPAGDLECCSFSSRIPGVADRIFICIMKFRWELAGWPHGEWRHA